MSEKLKKYIHKILIITAICLVAASGITLKQGINNMRVQAETNEQNLISGSTDIDTSITEDDLEKAQEAAGFKFKLPTIIPSKFRVNSIYNIENISGKDNFFYVNFTKEIRGELVTVIPFIASTKNPSEFLMNIDMDMNMTKGKFDVSEEKMKVGSIDGLSINVKYIEKYNLYRKFFAWQDENMWYCIAYEQGIGGKFEIPTVELKEIVSSMEYPDGNVYNVKNNSLNLELATNSTKVDGGISNVVAFSMGHTFPGTKVTFKVTSDGKEDIVGSSETNSESMAIFTYKRAAASNDMITAYVTDKPSIIAQTNISREMMGEDDTENISNIKINSNVSSLKVNDPQSIITSPNEVEVTADIGKKISGVNVTFSAEAKLSDGSFAGSSLTVKTDENGIARWKDAEMKAATWTISAYLGDNPAVRDSIPVEWQAN